MLRAALTTARRGPRLSRLLSAAATSAVPAPNQQPEVFCNQVRLAVASAGPGSERSGRRGLSFPAWLSLSVPFPAQMFSPCILPARDRRGPLSPIGAAAVAVAEPAPGPRGPWFTQKAQASQPHCDISHSFLPRLLQTWARVQKEKLSQDSPSSPPLHPRGRSCPTRTLECCLSFLRFGKVCATSGTWLPFSVE